MENNLVILNESKKNNLEFELDIEGLDTNNMKVAYVLETKDYDMSFQCSPKKGNIWVVTIPPLSHIEKTTYKYHITVIAEGYYFEPLTGVANVEGSHQIYATKPRQASPKPEQEIKQPIEEKKSPVVETKPTLPSDDVIQKIINEAKKKTKTQEPKQKSEKPLTEKKQPKEEKSSPLSDDAIQKIIAEAKKKGSEQKETTTSQPKKTPIFKKKEEKKDEQTAVEKKEEKPAAETPKVNEKDERLRKLLEAEKQRTQKTTPEKKVVFKKGSVVVH